jgi:hypothetical protein
MESFTKQSLPCKVGALSTKMTKANECAKKLAKVFERFGGREVPVFFLSSPLLLPRPATLVLFDL